MNVLTVLTPNFNMLATAAFIDPFRVSNYLDGTPHFRLRLVSLNGGNCLASNGMSLNTQALATLDKEQQDLVIVSSSWTPEIHSSPELQKALQGWSRQECKLGALDTGAFILAHAGLLNSYRATVHYEHIDAMNELFPAVQTVEDLFVMDGDRLTCCGGSASTDFALNIIRISSGDTLANRAARYMFHTSIRSPSTRQNPDNIEPLGSSVPAIVKQVIEIMELHLEEPLSLQNLCQQVGVSRRHLDRLFAQSLNKSPTLYYRDIRLDRARGLVTQTDLPLAEVAVAAGFSSQVHFSRSYKQRFGIPPRKDRIEGKVPFEYRAWPMHRKRNP